MRLFSRLALLLVFAMTAANVFAQRETQIQPAEESQSQYGRRFFVQLRAVFGRFRETDLQRAFDKAQPIRCTELINDKGEWRTVAFFNERRDLGDWYRTNFEEVKRDLAVFIFKGACRGERGPVQLTTKFPVAESVEAYSQGRVGLEDVEVNVNAPVRVSFDAQTQAYSFDLPYLFLVSDRDGERIYSLSPPRLLERHRYATDVTDHWDCKSVTAENITYQFLLCRTTTQPRDRPRGNLPRSASFGSSAFFILSDGKEASSDVKLTFSDTDNQEHKVEDVSRSVGNDSALDVQKAAKWDAPDADERVLDLQRDDFRLRFDPAAWTGRIGSAQLLSSGRLFSLNSSTSNGSDSCVWLPGSSSAANQVLAEDPEAINSVIKARDSDGLSAASIVFEVKAGNGANAGTLQCFFPRTPSAASITVGRWTAIVGENLKLEVRP